MFTSSNKGRGRLTEGAHMSHDHILDDCEIPLMAGVGRQKVTITMEESRDRLGKEEALRLALIFQCGD